MVKATWLAALAVAPIVSVPISGQPLAAAPLEAAPLGAARISVRDVEGRAILPQPHARIVSVAPAQTEILFAIGAGGNLRAVSDYCNHPPAARKLPKVGALTTLDVEKVVAHRPTLIVAAAGSIDKWRNLQKLTKAQVFAAEDGGIPALRRNLASLGYMTGRQQAAAALDRRIEARLEAAARATRHRPHPAVFYMVWDDPLIGAGPGSYADDLIRAAGGRNVVATSGVSGLYPRLSWEWLLAHPPDVFLSTHNLRKAAQAAALKVGARRTVFFDEDVVSRPGPRVLEALDAFVSAIHGPAHQTHP